MEQFCISFIAISTVFVFVFVRHGTICISICTGQVPYTDCADVPLEVTLSNSKDFSYVSKSGAYTWADKAYNSNGTPSHNFFIFFLARGDSNHGGGCVTLQLRGEMPGASTKVDKITFLILGIIIFVKSFFFQKVTVSLTTEKGKEVSQFRYVSAYQ